MTSDLALVLGLVLLLLIAPFAVSDFAAGRSYRLPIFLFVVGGSLVLAAVYGSPVPYRPGDLPEVVMRVIASFLR
jgi:ABC-type dipeptide/oligopeptide/nickel transport system permease subunit